MGTTETKVVTLKDGRTRQFRSKQERRVKVDTDRREPVLRGDAQQIAPRPPSGVIHHNIDPAEL